MPYSPHVGTSDGRSGDRDHTRTRLLEVGRSLVRAEAAALAGLEAQLDNSLVAAAEVLVRTRGKVLTAGVGTSGETARRMAHLLSVTGTPSLFLHPADGLHGGLGAISRGDVLIAISRGGESAELNEFTKRAKHLGAYVIALTENRDSPFAAVADLVVAFTASSESEPGGIVAMGSTLVAAAWGDALAVVAQDLRGYSWDRVLFTHPGGSVGRAATSATAR